MAKHSQKDFFIDLFPTRQGFDYFYGTPTSNDGVANLYRNEELIEPKSDMATLTRRYTDEAIGFMKQNQDKPFFVYLPHTMPHTRLDASEQFKGKSKRGLYGDVIEEIDFNVGRILDSINEMGLEEKTYVLFTSDNGPWLIKNKDLADGRLPEDHGGSAGTAAERQSIDVRGWRSCADDPLGSESRPGRNDLRPTRQYDGCVADTGGACGRTATS